jgi:hypothetical protein
MAQEDGCRTGAKLCPPAKTKRRNLADTKRRNGKRDSDNHVGLNAQIPIHATLKGSNCCQGQGITARGCAPVLDLCRALVKAGHDPRRPLHAYCGDVLALKVRSIGEGARLTVREDRAGPRFVAWEPFPRRVKALASRKAKRAARVATAEANQPNVGPGAAAATEFLSAPMLAPSRPKRASAAGRGKVPT